MNTVILTGTPRLSLDNEKNTSIPTPRLDITDNCPPGEIRCMTEMTRRQLREDVERYST